MRYSVHTTPAFVLRVQNTGEANRMYTLLTRDVGTIVASAQSVRLERSKLRYALQTLSFSEVSLVRGKGGWRITNAYSLGNLYFETGEKVKRELVIRISRLLRRLLVGESPDPDLFEVVEQGFDTLRSLLPAETNDFEIIFVIKILSALGYGTDSKELREFQTEPLSSESLRAFAREHRRQLVREINTTLRVSGL